MKKSCPGQKSAEQRYFSPHSQSSVKMVVRCHCAELMEKVGHDVALTDWEIAKLKKTGAIRWQSIFSFYSIECVKACFLIKKKGVWYLTEEGEDAIKLGPARLFEAAQKAYKQWKAKQPKQPPNEAEETEETDADSITFEFEKTEETALDIIENYIAKKNPYEFQDCVAALLRGMGYYTPFIAPKGKDGGVDVLAYRDPIGTESPRIQVQVKHREASATAKEIRELVGLLKKGDNVGIFVSTGGFTSEAKNQARHAQVHVELIDLPRFINFWQEFYHKLTDEDKNFLPLKTIFFLADYER